KTAGTLGSQSTLSARDERILGNVLPTYYGGVTLDLRYKNFNVNMMWRYSGGNKIMNITAQESLYNQGFLNSGTVLLSRWTKPGDVTDVPKLWYGRDNFINLTQPANSRFVEYRDFCPRDNFPVS